jgi:alcohol dehydrogenase (cytochrome c)
MQEDNATAWHTAVDQGHQGPGAAVDTAGLGAVGGYKSLADYTQLGGVLTVFALP